jgi:hypothetical protein
MTPEEKQTLIDFFKKYPTYESKFDWNKRDIRFEDFKDIINSQKTSKSNVHRISRTNDLRAIWDQRKEKDFEILYCDDTNIFITPLSHACAVFMNSFDCYGVGAKWCIGQKNDLRSWKSYTHDRSVFIMKYDKQDNKKYMIEMSESETNFDERYGYLRNRKHGYGITVWDERDSKIGCYDFYHKVNFEDNIDFMFVLQPLIFDYDDFINIFKKVYNLYEKKVFKT